MSKVLTTKDNPFNPSEDFKRWFMFDVEHHYKTCETLARLGNFDSEMTDDEFEEEYNYAANRMIELDFERKYILIDSNDETNDENLEESYEELQDLDEIEEHPS